MKYPYVFLAASVGILAACSQVNEFDAEQKTKLEEGKLVERVIFEVPALRFLGEDGGTRASLSTGDDFIHFAWEESDTVGIYPNQGAQVFFSMAEGVGTNVATFDGGGWALRENSTYSCYYPFVGNMYLHRDAIPVSFDNQEFSPANQEQADMPSYGDIRFFLASEGTTSESGSLRFHFDILNTVIRIKACGLPAGTYTKLSLTTEDSLFVKEGSFGLEERIITGKTYSNSLEVSLKNFTLTEASTEENPALVFLTSAPVDLSGKTVAVRIYSDDNSVYRCEKTPTYPYQAHGMGGLMCNMVKESSAIFYTSSDNSVVEPTPDSFGEASIVSNKYDGSKGVIVFDKDLTLIGAHAFENCETLTGITIPEAVTGIGDYAFANCTNLASIHENATSIGEYAFQNCQRLTSITISNGMTSIGKGTFQNCISLSSIRLPDGMESIGDWAFEKCDSLTDFYIPESVTNIGTGAFSNCENLARINLPVSTTIIKPSTFAGCISLAEINIPDELRTIGDSAFESCGQLPNIVLPDKVTEIGSFAFTSCGSFTTFTIPPHVTSIKYQTFLGCSNLSSIIIHENVTSIGNGAFKDCSGLSHITVHAQIPPAVEIDGEEEVNVFETMNNCLIYVPSESLEDYKTANGWSNYADRICDHVYVDMGNGMKWATTNVGAIGPDDLGQYFAWGGTTPLTTPDPSYHPSNPFTDTAHSIWGGNWRMPKQEEWSALKDETKYVWTWDDHRKGYTVKSIETNNTIFLPAAGIAGREKEDGILEEGPFYVGQEGHYWTRSIHSEGNGWALIIAPPSVVSLEDYVFGAALSVRPIYQAEPLGDMETVNDSREEIEI